MSQSLHLLPEGMREPHGLYHPRNEHDACGIGLIANINNIPELCIKRKTRDAAMMSVSRVG